ncbi:MAG TPA: hypothetical protein VLA44_01725 [Clostridia bacterium]|nr:hypothetical protein [Clostridia bacterium]
MGEDVAGVADEVIEKLVLGRRQVEGLATQARLLLREVDLEAARPSGTTVRARRGRHAVPAKNGTDACDEFEVDVLVLAALEGQLHAGNADGVRARIVAEAANGPTLPEADPILTRNGVTVLPDIRCNAGGVIVSYFEWAQNRAALAWTVDEGNERLRQRILAAADRVWARSNADGISARLAAHALAVERVAEATRLRGQSP